MCYSQFFYNMDFLQIENSIYCFISKTIQENISLLFLKFKIISYQVYCQLKTSHRYLLKQKLEYKNLRFTDVKMYFLSKN